uniref:probable membrane-associated kinase regulator 6 n=1 Tax=Erigeron canadensis TaxID=72917 RepID=UPI001CB9872D|nr:probable membrane-associated kinase regulator 6 [Erigeron canadensis]
MEASQPLSVESFSYSWLLNQNLSLDSPNCSFRVSFDAADGASFIEMDPNLTPSKRFLVHHEFNFDIPTSQSPTTAVHADKLISNGILVPVISCGPSSDSIRVSPSSSTQEEGRFRKSRSLSLRKCNKLPKRIIQKYMDLVRPLWCRIRRGTSDSSRVQGVENWECSSISGPRPSEACKVDNRRTSCDSESSIHEAVVHCKKTIGMD